MYVHMPTIKYLKLPHKLDLSHLYNKKDNNNILSQVFTLNITYGIQFLCTCVLVHLGWRCWPHMMHLYLGMNVVVGMYYSL